MNSSFTRPQVNLIKWTNPQHAKMLKYDTTPKLHSFFKYFERPFPRKSVITARVANVTKKANPQHAKMLKYDTIPKLHSFFKYFKRPFLRKSVIRAKELGFATPEG